MDKIKRFIDCSVPYKRCNLKCQYCYITLEQSWKGKASIFQYSAKHIGQALSQERLGGLCLLNICGDGETLMPPQITPIVRALLEEGHYVMIITNGTIARRIDELLGFPKSLLLRLGFKFSFHYLELIRTHRMDVFFSNVAKARTAGCSISVEITPHDELVPYIDDIKTLCDTNLGAHCHVTVARNEALAEKPILSRYALPEYKNIWATFESPLFDFKLAAFNKIRREFCYAGDWSAVLDLGTGELRQCYKSNFYQNIFRDISKPIQFRAVGNNCQEPYCYNAHAFMTLGVIPEIPTPPYDAMRNRMCSNHSEWLNEPMKYFFNTRLSESNHEYHAFKKIKTNLLNRYSRISGILSDVKNKYIRHSGS